MTDTKQPDPMTTDTLAGALQGFTEGTLVVIRFKTSGGGSFERAVRQVEYVAATESADAYLALIPFQGDGT